MKLIPCILCGKNENIKIATGYDRYVQVDKTIYTIVRCTNCGLVYTNPQPSIEELKKYYPTNYPPFKRHGSVREIEKNKDYTLKKVLDFGCGGGNNLLSIREKHPKWELHGFDIGENKEVINIGNDISIIYDDFNKLSSSFNTEYFDIIYMNNVLEHLNNPVKILSDLSALLKKDGIVIIEVPNINSIKFKIFGKYFSSLDIPRHLFHFSPKTLENLCNKIDLKIENVELNGTTKSTLRSIYYLLGIKSKNLNPILFKIFTLLTKIIGKKRIDDDVIIATVKKI